MNVWYWDFGKLLIMWREVEQRLPVAAVPSHCWDAV